MKHLLQIILCLGACFSAALAQDLISTETSQSTTWEAFTEPYQQVEIAAPEPGRIAYVHVQRGANVKVGELLVELDTNILEAQKQVAAYRAKSRSKVDSAIVEYEKYQRRYETLRTLNEQGAGTPDELQEAESDANVARLGVETAEEELKLYELQVNEIEARIEQRRIRSQFAGVVTEVHRKPGEYVSAVEPRVVTVVDLSKLRATFFLPTQQVIKLHKGLIVQVRFLEGKNSIAEAEIEHISSVTRADSGRVRVDVLIDNLNHQFRSGVRCSLVSGKEPVRATSTPSVGPLR